MSRYTETGMHVRSSEIDSERASCRRASRIKGLASHSVIYVEQQPVLVRARDLLISAPKVLRNLSAFQHCSGTEHICLIKLCGVSCCLQRFPCLSSGKGKFPFYVNPLFWRCTGAMAISVLADTLSYLRHYMLIWCCVSFCGLTLFNEAMSSQNALSMVEGGKVQAYTCQIQPLLAY